MRLRLKEDPREWRNFALLCGGMMVVVLGIGFWRGVVSSWGLAIGGAAVFLWAVMAWVRPGIFRGLYRVAMSVSFRIGQVMGKVILGLVYILVVTPLGWALRMGGKDLLEMRGGSKRESYWKEARPKGKFEQQF